MVQDFDLIIVGGGIGGSCLAAAVAATGARVLVCEREREFRDRVRGEGMHPWGVGELRQLGMHEVIASGCGHESPRWQTLVGGALVTDRNLVETTRDRAGSLNFYHPAMQEVVLTAAAAAGAEVRRGASVRGVTPGVRPAVTVEQDRATTRPSARLVVLAGGRGGKLQAELGFDRHTQPPGQIIAGMLVRDLPIDEHTIRLCIGPEFSRACIYFPLGKGRVRAYVVHRHDDTLRLSGDSRRDAFMGLLRELDPELAQFPDARPAGVLASFPGAAQWSEQLHRDGVVLIGDAAGSVDPSFGCGLAITARDARVLSEELARNGDWQQAAERYSARRHEYYQAQLRIEAWMRAILYTPGPQSDALRAEALPRMGAAAPDLSGLGPDSPHDDAAREALFGPLASSMP